MDISIVGERTGTEIVRISAALIDTFLSLLVPIKRSVCLHVTTCPQLLRCYLSSIFCIYSLLQWCWCWSSITMIREHNLQVCIRWIYASPSVLSLIAEPALVRVANCKVCKCTVCSGSSMISPRMFIIMRPTLCGEVRPKIQLRKRNRYRNGSYALRWAEKTL